MPWTGNHSIPKIASGHNSTNKCINAPFKQATPLNHTTFILKSPLYRTEYVVQTTYKYSRNKTFVPVFYRGNKTSVRVRLGMNQITSALERVPILSFAIKHEYMFYSDSYTTAPLQCAAQVFFFLESVR